MRAACYLRLPMEKSRLLLLAIAVALALCGCDRRIEPYVPGEEPSQPNLSKIFPPGSGSPGEGPVVLPPPPGGGPRGAPPMASNAPPIRGVVRVAPELAQRVPDGAVLFLIARRGGGGPPVAVKRFVSPELPLRFSIGPEDRMIQAMPFEGPLRISARIDADGNATTRTPGDLQGTAAGAFEPGASDIDLVLDEVL